MQTQQIKKEEITFKEVIVKVSSLYALLKSRWKSILLMAIAGAGLGFLLFFISKPVYTAQLSFVLNSEKGKLGSYSGIAAQFGLNIGGAGGSIFTEDNNIIALMRSRSMVIRTMVTPTDRPGQTLADRYLDIEGYRQAWAKNKNLADINFSAYREHTSRIHDSVLNMIYKQIIKKELTVGKPDNKSDIINITTIAKDEYFAKTFTERLMKNVADYYTEGQTQKAQENVAILSRQVDSVRGLLNSAITGVAVSSDANPNMNPAFQRLRVPSQRRMVDVEMQKEILQELVKNLEVARVTLRQETPLMQVIDAPMLPLERTSLKRAPALLGGFFAGALLMIMIITIRAFFRSVMA